MKKVLLIILVFFSLHEKKIYFEDPLNIKNIERILPEIKLFSKAVDYEDFKVDILILEKALSGGVYPIVLSDNKIMEVINPCQHGSTFYVNPLGFAVSMTALDVVINDNLAENALKMGEIFRKSLTKYANSNSIIKSIRGKGLLNAIKINDKFTAYNICLNLKDIGILVKPTLGNIIRFAPPLIITDKEMLECIDIITQTLNNFLK